MSHASGIVRFSDGEIKHFEYDGTSDVVLSNLFDTYDEMYQNWRNQEWKTCTCGNEESCMAHTTYGSGFYIKCLGCRKCNTIRSVTDDFITFEEDAENPLWASNYYANIGINTF